MKYPFFARYLSKLFQLKGTTMLEKPLLIRYTKNRKSHYVSNTGKKHEINDHKTLEHFNLDMDMCYTIQEIGLFNSIPTGQPLSTRWKALPNQY